MMPPPSLRSSGQTLRRPRRQRRHARSAGLAAAAAAAAVVGASRRWGCARRAPPGRSTSRWGAPRGRAASCSSGSCRCCPRAGRRPPSSRARRLSCPPSRRAHLTPSPRRLNRAHPLPRRASGARVLSRARASCAPARRLRARRPGLRPRARRRASRARSHTRRARAPRRGSPQRWVRPRRRRGRPRRRRGAAVRPRQLGARPGAAHRPASAGTSSQARTSTGAPPRRRRRRPWMRWAGDARRRSGTRGWCRSSLSSCSASAPTWTRPRCARRLRGVRCGASVRGAPRAPAHLAPARHSLCAPRTGAARAARERAQPLRVPRSCGRRGARGLRAARAHRAGPAAAAAGRPAPLRLAGGHRGHPDAPGARAVGRPRRAACA